MATILDEYEDALSRSAVLQPGCPSVGIPHSGKEEEGSATLFGSASTCGDGVGGRSEFGVTSRTCIPGLSL
jgi:hypothetical protein